MTSTPEHPTGPHPDSTDRPAPTDSPNSAGHGPHRHEGVLSLSRLLTRSVLGAKGQTLGRLGDVIVRLRGTDYPLVTGIVADLGGRRLFVPAEQVTDWDPEHLTLCSARLDLREFERRDGEVLLRADILGHRLIDIPRAALVRAWDLELAPTDDGHRMLVGVDTRPRSWWRRALTPLRRRNPHRDPEGVAGAGRCRDWTAFEALIGHRPSALARTASGRLGRLKAAQVADLIEQATREEQSELLDHVHADPEFEADVFEELDEHDQSKLLRDRSDPDVAAVLARMRADDAADAVMDLPQHRRHPVLELLPAGQRTKVTTLLGFNPTSAGGLMGLDYLALPATAAVEEALDRARTAHTLQPEALTTVFTLDQAGRLIGTANLVTVLQAGPTTLLGEIAAADPVRVSAHADLPDVAVLMTDYNLLTLPVVDHDNRLLGVITVDDALEAIVPDHWRRRDPSPHPEPADHNDHDHDQPVSDRTQTTTGATRAAGADDDHPPRRAEQGTSHEPRHPAPRGRLRPRPPRAR